MIYSDYPVKWLSWRPTGCNVNAFFLKMITTPEKESLRPSIHIPHATFHNAGRTWKCVLASCRRNGGWFVFQAQIPTIRSSWRQTAEPTYQRLKVYDCSFLALCVPSRSLCGCGNALHACWPRSDFMAMNRLSAAMEGMTSMPSYGKEAFGFMHWTHWHQRDLMRALTFVSFSNYYAVREFSAWV